MGGLGGPNTCSTAPPTSTASGRTRICGGCWLSERLNEEGTALLLACWSLSASIWCRAASRRVPKVIPAVGVDAATNEFVAQVLEASAIVFSAADGAFTCDDDNMSTAAKDASTKSVNDRKRRKNGQSANIIADAFFHSVVLGR
jgi:hypothetical protein